jgi:hypothetical protein
MLVLGSGMSVGIVAADMQHDWAGAEATRQQAAVVNAARAEVPEPVIVIRKKVRHATPEPVVVRKKVYRPVRGQTPAQSQARRSTGASAPRSARPATPSSGSSRTVVAPAPAPAPARAKAPTATTSKTS